MSGCPAEGALLPVNVCTPEKQAPVVAKVCLYTASQLMRAYGKRQQFLAWSHLLPVICCTTATRRSCALQLYTTACDVMVRTKHLCMAWLLAVLPATFMCDPLMSHLQQAKTCVGYLPCLVAGCIRATSGDLHHCVLLPAHHWWVTVLQACTHDSSAHASPTSPQGAAGSMKTTTHPTPYNSSPPFITHLCICDTILHALPSLLEEQRTQPGNVEP